MPDDDTTAQFSVSAETPSAAPTTPAAQDGSPDGSLATLNARLDKLEGLDKELKAERSAHGRTRAMLKAAAGENADRFTQAFTSYEREKVNLLSQGYSERVINALMESDPEAVLELAQNAPRPAVDPGDELKAAREEIAKMRGEPPASAAPRNGATRERLAPLGDTPAPAKTDLEYIAEAADNPTAWDSKRSDEVLRRLMSR